MRVPLSLSLALSLALPALANGHWPQSGDVITPTDVGLSRATEEGIPRASMPFGSGFQDVMGVMIGVYGHDVDVGFLPDCGAGPMVSVQIHGQIDLMFQDDELVGWMLSDDSGLTTDTGLWVGAPIAFLSTSGPVEYFESGIGQEFAAGDYFGLLSVDGAQVQAIWSGETCIFR